MFNCSSAPLIMDISTGTKWTAEVDRPVRIGYWLTAKKKKKLAFQEFEKLCRMAGMKVQEIDLDRPLPEQGHFDVILHKVTDELILRAENGDASAMTKIEEFKEYSRKHPDVIMLDSLDQTLRLRYRFTMFSLLQQCDIIQTDQNVFVPSFVELQTKNTETNKTLLRNANMSYPILCKPSLADGTDSSHVMSIIYSEDGLSDIQPPCVAQELINHDGVLHKIYVIGDLHYLVQRPSLKNLTPGNFRTETFHTREVSKPDSMSHLNNHSKMRRQDSCCYEPDPQVVASIASSIGRTLSLDLFGVDVVIENSTGRYAIIDINPFPGYDGVENFPSKLLQFMCQKVARAFRNNNSVLHQCDVVQGAWSSE